MQVLTFVIASFVVVIVTLYFLWRTEWVSNQMTRVYFIQGELEYSRLPSYAFILFARPWIWDIEKFKRPSS